MICCWLGAGAVSDAPWLGQTLKSKCVGRVGGERRNERVYGGFTELWGGVGGIHLR